MDDNPTDPSAYMNVMKKTRRRRRFFFGTVLIYIPALVVTYQISPTNRAMGTVFGIWVVMLIIATSLAAVCRCPRCGNYFHVQGITLLVLRKCLHCQLHISDDTIT
jgi:hypothetical protein